MKLLRNNQSNRNTKILKLAAIGMISLFFSSLVFVSDPVGMLADWQLSLGPRTLMHYLWLRPPLEVFVNVYLFNYTNVEDFMNGRASKLKVVEIGPYVYQEKLEHNNVTFNANNTVTFSPQRIYKLRRDKSIGDPMTDHVIAPNIPYMGISTKAASLSTISALAFSAITRRMKVQPFLDVTVDEFLWGYEDHLVHLASKIVPSWIDFESFGILDRMFNESIKRVTLNLPRLKNRKFAEQPREYSIDNWHGDHGLKFWEYKDTKNATLCNKVQGGFDGTLFPRDMNFNDTFYIYRKTFCRTLPMKFSHTVNFGGIEGYSFKLDKRTFNSRLGDPNSSCFCKGNKCLKRGLGNVAPCYYNIPLAMSFPHFMHADPSLLRPFEGLHPDESMHGSEIILQPKLGAPMHVHTRFQANQVIGDIRFDRDMAHFENMVLPLIWADVNIEDLPGFIRVLLHVLFKVLPAVEWALIIVLLLTGISMLCMALLCCCWHGAMEQTLEAAATKPLPIIPILKHSHADCSKEDSQLLPVTKLSLPV